MTLTLEQSFPQRLRVTQKLSARYRKQVDYNAFQVWILIDVLQMTLSIHFSDDSFLNKTIKQIKQAGSITIGCLAQLRDSW